MSMVQSMRRKKRNLEIDWVLHWQESCKAGTRKRAKRQSAKVSRQKARMSLMEYA